MMRHFSPHWTTGRSITQDSSRALKLGESKLGLCFSCSSDSSYVIIIFFNNGYLVGFKMDSTQLNLAPPLSWCQVLQSLGSKNGTKSLDFVKTVKGTCLYTYRNRSLSFWLYVRSSQAASFIISKKDIASHKKLEESCHSSVIFVLGCFWVRKPMNVHVGEHLVEEFYLSRPKWCPFLRDFLLRAMLHPKAYQTTSVWIVPKDTQSFPWDST